VAVVVAVVEQSTKVAEALAWFNYLVGCLISKPYIWLCISSSALHILRIYLYACFDCWPKTVQLVSDDVLQLIVWLFN